MSSLNGDMSRPVVVDTNQMEWVASPTGTVLRKRLHLVGEPEAGQVTSLVRYLPGAEFPEHDHPEGEEILVLEGVFSDHRGDAGPGSHLLNPEGYRHAPFSKPGCLIFVKLRQYDGPGRPYRNTQTKAADWQPSSEAGIAVQVLFEEPWFPDVTRLERWDAGATSRRSLRGGGEYLVIDGGLEVDGSRHGPGAWFRLPPGATLDATSLEGCELYVKEGGVAHLASDPS